MISKEEYDILVEISKTGAPKLFLETNSLLRNMCKEKLIEPIVTKTDRNNLYYHGYRILPLGKRAMEEYESHMARDAREDKTLEIANEANAIARKANKISSLSLIVSIASGLIALASIFVAIFT